MAHTINEVEAAVVDMAKQAYAELGETERAELLEKMVDLVGVEYAHEVLGTTPS